MEDLYGTASSSGAGLASESEDITNILNQLLQSSSPPFSSAPSTTSFTAFKAKYAHLLHSPPPPPHHQPAEGLLGPEDRLRFGRSENRTEPEPSSGFGFSDPSGGFFGAAEAKDGAENAFSDANTSLKGRRVSPENDLGDFSCDSEGPEASDVPSNSAPPRSSSKRSRAAEVHNLSEKRRRSRINEKMKALQNLIPNSNKTDKASMLDEAIEYLKQLQLQVQMLSMRNGLSLHPVCLPGVVQPMQLSLPQTGLVFNDASTIKFPSPGIGTASFSGHEEPPLMPQQHPYDNQPPLLPPLGFRPLNLTPPSTTELLNQGIKPRGRSDTLPSKSPDV